MTGSQGCLRAGCGGPDSVLGVLVARRGNDNARMAYGCECTLTAEVRSLWGRDVGVNLEKADSLPDLFCSSHHTLPRRSHCQSCGAGARYIHSLTSTTSLFACRSIGSRWKTLSHR